MCVGWAVTGWTGESGRSQLLSSVSAGRAGLTAQAAQPGLYNVGQWHQPAQPAQHQ